MSFFDIRDQEVAVRLLRNMLSRERVPHALLFSGPSGVGKHLTALQFAKAANCLSKRSDACNECISCRKIEHGNHPDLKVVVPHGKRREIKMNDMDEIIEICSFRPFEGRHRVYLIHDADRINFQAQNHFLKVLEEPPSATMFILLTEYPRRLLGTIRSRCQHVRFGALKPETVSELLLRDRDLPPETARAIAALSQGQMSRACALVETERRAVALDVVKRLAAGEDPMAISEAFSKHMKSVEEMVKETLKPEFITEEVRQGTKEEREEAEDLLDAEVSGRIRRELMEYLYLMSTWYRDEVVYAAAGEEASVLNHDEIARFKPRAPDSLGKKIGAIDQAWTYIERNLFRDRVFRDLFFALAD